MKNLIFLILVLCTFCTQSNAQVNFLDNYIGASVTATVIASSTNQVSEPQDLDFKPNSNELWIANRGNTNGGTTVIIFNAGMFNQTSQYRKDSHSSHFMRLPTAIAFGDDGKWACTSEIQSTAGPTSTFMGPGLWTGDTSIFARVFQNNWVNGFPLGSHYDMLHQSPFAMGIAHDSAMAYWVNDGHNGNICLYDYVQHHGPGYDNHSAGKIWRYTDVLVTRVPNIPSHMVLDKVNQWLYFIDGSSKKIKRLNTATGTVTGNLSVPSSSQEPLASYKKVEGATVEELATLTSQPCGIDYYKDRLVVSDNTTGEIFIYNTSGTFTLLTTIVTGLPGMMGVKVGPDGLIWCVNKTTNSVYRLDITMPVTDVAITGIASPVVQNFKPDFYATNFDVCSGTITPEVTFVNKGSGAINSIDFQYTIDNGTPITHTWTGTLTPAGNTFVVFPSASVSNGSHLLTVSVLSANGSPDEIDLNDVFEGSFRVVDPPATLPYSEGFSATVFPPDGWNYVNYNPNNKMTRVTPGGFGLSVGCMKMDNFSGAVDITGQKDYLMSPIIDMTSANANTWLRFNVAYAKYNNSSNDALHVLVSTDCGNTWGTLYNKSGTALSTGPVSTAAWTPSATQWRTDSVSLSTYAGQATVMFAFTAISNFGNNLYVDDIFAGDITTGIFETTHSSQISISPSPASTSVHVVLSKPLSQNAICRIYSVEGRLMASHPLPGSQLSFDVDITGLANGLYIVKVEDEENLFVKNIVKQ